MATIKEIAKEAGVGIATVSRVVNGSPLVKDATRTRVLEVIRRLNYRPNIMARKLVKGTFSETTVGIILPLIDNQFLFEVIAGIYGTLKKQRYNILIFNAGKGRDMVFEHIVEENLAGLLLLGDPPMSPEERNLILVNNIPYVYLDHHERDENYVAFDNACGGKLAAEYLYEKGCRKPMFIGLTNFTQQQSERLEAFREEFFRQGIEGIAGLYLSSPKEVLEQTRTAYETGECDGIFFFSDELAMGALRIHDVYATDGKRIPLCGYDDIRTSEYIGLTTIRQSAAVLGKEGAEAILTLIETPDWRRRDPIVQELLTPTLVVRET